MVLSCLSFIFIEFKEFLHLFIVGVYAYVCSHLFLGVSVQVRGPLEQVHSPLLPCGPQVLTQVIRLSCPTYIILKITLNNVLF